MGGVHRTSTIRATIFPTNGEVSITRILSGGTPSGVTVSVSGRDGSISVRLGRGTPVT